MSCFLGNLTSLLLNNLDARKASGSKRVVVGICDSGLGVFLHLQPVPVRKLAILEAIGVDDSISRADAE